MTTIRNALEAIEVLKRSADELTETERHNYMLTISIMWQALKPCKGAQGLTPDQRQKVRSAINMGAVALGMDDEAAA